MSIKLLHLLLLQKKKRPPLLVDLFRRALGFICYAVCISVVILVGSAVIRRAAAVSSANSGNIGVAATSSAPSLPGPGSVSSYAPKEYIKVREYGFGFCHTLQLSMIRRRRMTHLSILPWQSVQPSYSYACTHL